MHIAAYLATAAATFAAIAAATPVAQLLATDPSAPLGPLPPPTPESDTLFEACADEYHTGYCEQFPLRMKSPVEVSQCESLIRSVLYKKISSMSVSRDLKRCAVFFSDTNCKTRILQVPPGLTLDSLMKYNSDDRIASYRSQKC